VAQGALRRRRAAAGLLAAGALAAEVAAPAGTALLAVLDVAVAVAFAAGAAAAAAASPRAADLALAVAAAWVLGTLAGLDDVPSHPADVAVLLHRGPLTLLLLTYPGRRLHGAAARALAIAALLAPFADGNARTVSAVVAGLVAVATAARAARAPAALRAPQTAAAAAAAAIAATAGVAAAGLGSATALLVAYDLVLVATAAGLLGSLAGGRWSAAATTGLVVELGTAPAGAPITARLAEVLGDPSLQLRLRLVGGSWTDEAGRPAPAPAVGDGRRGLTRRLLDDGTELALLHDPAAIPDPAAAASAVAVAATAVDNARRDREVQARIEQLRRLRRGLLDAADEERRQLELELRSGPLHEVELLDQLLRNLPYEHVEALRRELALAHGELVDTAHGLYPTALEKHGLAKSLSAAAARSPVPVTVDANLDETTLPRPGALTAYYVATEALTNIAKHARAEHARLELSACAGELLLRIVDDGVGGADPAGSGLSGLRDRVRAVNGELRVRSPHGTGTVIEARLPLSGT
jgi:signal transduction histidine kinase